MFRTIKTLIFVLSLSLVSAFAQTITAPEAAQYIGQHETVCGTIAGEHTAFRSRGQPTFLDIGRPYPDQIFTVLIWGENRASVGQLPRSGRFCAVGTIREYKGAPEIIIRESKSWYAPK